MTDERPASSREPAVTQLRSDVRASTTRWHARGLNNGLIFGATFHGVTRLPTWCSYTLGHVGTWLAWRLMRDGTGGLIENFRIVRPNASPHELEQLALLTYRSYARDTIDFIRSLSMSAEEVAAIVTQQDCHWFDDLLAEGRGLIVLGGHFGNWEFGGVAMRRLLGHPLSVVGRPEASPAVGAIRRRMRDTLGIETIEIGRMLETALHIRRLLDANGVVAMLADRHLGRDRVDVSFFGRTTAFLRSPAMIAHLSGAPMLPSFMLRQPDGRFVVSCGEPIRVDASASPEDSVQRATQQFATQLEQQIRAHPQCWYQFYPYWSEGEGA